MQSLPGIRIRSISLLCMAVGLLGSGCDKRELIQAKMDKSEERYASPGAAPHDLDRALEHVAGEDYEHIDDNDFIEVARAPLSTFAVDVDTAAYSNVRRYLDDGLLPPNDAVRIEELINYFDYDYPQPTGEVPFSVVTEVAACPWNEAARLVHIGLQGKAIAADQLPPRNLVFLFDVSGSMNSPDKLPLVKRSMRLLVDQLDARDHVSIVVYAGASGVVLEPTSGADAPTILAALERLEAGGSTNGGAGIERAYALARANFDPQGINRVILATDGDFNVGIQSQGELERLIERERDNGVFLTVLGFGTGNIKDSTMEMLADKGNGNYAYIDSLAEARKVLVEEAGATLVTIAKDVKIQVEFNPLQVASYRLVGYENRLLEARDFDDDNKDAGEIGAGHTVTALYEIIPAKPDAAPIDGEALRYQDARTPSDAAQSGELALLKLRYKQPDGDQSELVSVPVTDGGATLEASSGDFRFAAAVAQFGMLLRGSKHKGASNWDSTKRLAEGAIGQDEQGYRRELLGLIARAAELSRG